MSKIAFYTLGCKVNQYESEAIKQMFIARGDEIVEPEDIADVYIINTCTVTQMSEKKSRQMIRRAKRINPNAIVVVIGCYAQIAPDEIMGIDGVNLVIGTSDRNKILEYMDALSYGEKISYVSDIDDKRQFEELKIDGTEDRTRVFLKVQDGCNIMCTYCIIPYARGRIRSRDIENSVSEVKRVVENGYKEVVLSGIHLSSYGYDLGKTRLIDLIEKLHSIDGLERIRLGSLEPRVVTDEFAQKLHSMPKVCDQFHLSLQSGCDSVLKRMNRKYRVEHFSQCVDNLRKYYKNPALTTDIIVGFPEESDEEHTKSLEYCRQIGFSEMHIFKYSPRYGTPAATMENQVSELDKTNRSREFIELADDMKLDYENSLLGTKQDILVEKYNYIEFRAKIDGAEKFLGDNLIMNYAEGRCMNHAQMMVFGVELKQNEIITAEVKSIYDSKMLGGNQNMIDFYIDIMNRKKEFEKNKKLKRKTVNAS